jgi:hypothetical protein
VKIQVVGSVREIKQDPVMVARFKAAGKALGAALARSGHTIVVGIPSWSYPMHDSLTEYIIQGADTVAAPADKQHEILFLGPWTPEPEDKTPAEIDSVRDFKTLTKNIHLTQKPISSSTMNYGANLIPNLNEVDAVILVSGADGTASIGFAAQALKIPLLTVNALGGVAETMFEDFLGKELLALQEKKKISDISVLNVPWAAESEMANDEAKAAQAGKADAIIRLTEQLIKYFAQEKGSTKAVLTLSIVLGPLFIGAWMIVFFTAIKNQINLTLAFFILLFLAALIGWSLHTLIGQKDETTVLTFSSIAIDAALSIIIAFGLMLFYLIGGIAFTGNVVVLNAVDSTFLSIALSMSVLGLAAGALIPIRQLIDRLSKAIAP